MQSIQEVMAAQACLDAQATVNARINPPGWSGVLAPKRANFSLSCLDLFCQKTGRRIGRKDETELQKTCELLGTASAEISLFHGVGLGIHPLWLRTDNVGLDNLQMIDPVGYACFCLGIATTANYALHGKEKYAGAYAERYWALARANALISRHSEEELHKLNAALCGLLTFAPDTLVYIFRVLGNVAKTPDKLATMPCDALIIAIEKAIGGALNGLMYAEGAIKRAKLEDKPRTPTDMAQKAPSNIRLQKSARRRIAGAETNFLRARLEKELLDLNPFGEAEKPVIVREYSATSTTYKEIYAKTSKGLGVAPKIDRDGFFEINFDKLENFAEEYGEIGDTSGDVLGYNDDDDDGEVIVRKIARHEIPSVQREIEARIAAIPAQSSKPMSAFTSRLIAKGKMPGITVEPQKELPKPTAIVPTSRFARLFKK